MTENEWELGRVATQTEEVIVNKKEDKTYSMPEAIVILLNKTSKIEELLGK